MKKLFILIMVLSIVAVGAFADTNIGVNFRPNEDTELGTDISVEAGVSGDYIGLYGVVTVNNPAVLAGATLSMPDVPFFLFGGAGARFVTVSTTSQVYLDYAGYTADLPLYVDGSEIKADLIYEVGVGIDAGPVYWKVGYFNDGDHAFSLSAGASFN